MFQSRFVSFFLSIFREEPPASTARGGVGGGFHFRNGGRTLVTSYKLIHNVTVVVGEACVVVGGFGGREDCIGSPWGGIGGGSPFRSVEVRA